MIAVGNNLDENTLDFENEISVFDTTYTVESNSDFGFNDYTVRKKIKYLKVVIESAAVGGNIESIYEHKFEVRLKVHYTKAGVKDQVFNFFPNFTYESGGDTYFIVELSGDKTSTFSLNFVNKYNADIDVTNFRLYYITEVTSDNIQETLHDSYTSNPTEYNSMMNEYVQNNNLHVPVVTSLPSTTGLADGYICLLVQS